MVKLKRLLYVVIILSVTVIVGWAAWYYIFVNPRLTKEPVEVFNTPKRTLDDSSEILPNSVPVDTDVDSQAQVPNSSKHRTHKNVPNSPESISSTTNPKTHQHEHENEQGLSKEELAELREKNKEELKNYEIQVNELLYSLNELKKQVKDQKRVTIETKCVQNS